MPAMLKCAPCGEQPKEKFAEWCPANAAKQQRISDRNFRCFDCQHPPCANPACQTCPECRERSCKKDATCTASIKPLNARLMPRTLEEKASYECDLCMFPACSVCGAAMTKIQRERFKKRPGWAGTRARTWTCGPCEAEAFTRENLRRARE